MSWRATRILWLFELPTSQKIVLMCLADMANDRGFCWPSIATIARRTGLKDRAVQKALKLLEAQGLIRRQERPGRATIYTVHPRSKYTGSPAPNALPHAVREAPHMLRIAPATVAPEPSHEPENESAAHRTKKTVTVGDRLRASNNDTVQAALGAIGEFRAHRKRRAGP